jgi:hypothetical protein
MTFKRLGGEVINIKGHDGTDHRYHTPRWQFSPKLIVVRIHAEEVEIGSILSLPDSMREE